MKYIFIPLILLATLTGKGQTKQDSIAVIKELLKDTFDTVNPLYPIGKLPMSWINGGDTFRIGRSLDTTGGLIILGGDAPAGGQDTVKCRILQCGYPVPSPVFRNAWIIQPFSYIMGYNGSTGRFNQRIKMHREVGISFLLPDKRTPINSDDVWMHKIVNW